jgi:predicted MFS family arabinose efflux permease
LLAANARLDQGGTAAQTTGPLMAGALVTLLGAPLAVLADAASYLFSGAMLAALKLEEPLPAAASTQRLVGEISDGLRWVYRHPTLAPLSISTHAWFLFNSVLGAVFVPFAVRGLGLSAAELGIALAAAGAAGLVGAVLATRLGERWGVGPSVIGCRLLSPLACAVIALAPGGHGRAAAVAMLALGQAIYGFQLGAENANEMSFRQTVTPDHLQGRVNTSMRSLNRAMVVVAAPLGGLLADRIGFRPTLWIAAAGFLLVPLALAATPFGRAREGEPA